MKYLLLLLLIPTPALANDYSFTSGSMTQTTTATQEVTEVIAIEKFGGTVKTWNGDNVEASGSNITLDTTAWTIVDETQPWQLEVMTRAAGIIETQDIERTIETTTTTNTLSVFSQ